MSDFDRESMLEMFIYEMNQQIEQLENNIIQTDDEYGYSPEKINEIFRAMHTIKGSSAMMLFENISVTAHAIEDLFFLLRENQIENVDYTKVTDLVLEVVDFIKQELEKIEDGEEPNGKSDELISNIKNYILELKGEKETKKDNNQVVNKTNVTKENKEGILYKATVFFEDNVGMENIRAYTLIHNLEDICTNITYIPEDIMNDKTADLIKKDGFTLEFISELSYSEMNETLQKTIYLKSLSLEIIDINDNKNKHTYKAIVFFEDNVGMENIRAYTLIHNLEDICTNITYIPEDIMNDETADLIKKDGFTLEFTSEYSYSAMNEILQKTIYLKNLTLEIINNNDNKIKHMYKATIFFEDGCEMENVRAYTLVYNLQNKVDSIVSLPEDILSESSVDVIRAEGLQLQITTDKSYEELKKELNLVIYLKELHLEEIFDIDNNITLDTDNKTVNNDKKKIEDKSEFEDKSELHEENSKSSEKNNNSKNRKSAMQAISVNVQKLDQLLNLVGELVISEAMVTQNPDLEGIELDSFTKEARQLHKIINEVQDTVMSMRMVPLSPTFFKMHRIVRDMCKQLGKEVQLDIIGEDTEVDKNIIEHISDPLMHIIRNSIDHGIEMPEKRRELGKFEKGKVVLEAKNTGGDVLIIIKDDGAGFDKEKIMAKAKKQGLLTKPEEEYTDKEIYQFIFLPGFSTNDKVTSYSGRGVGMDVVSTNIEIVGGTVIVDSVANEGSTFILKIPLTLAIIEGMLIEIGKSKYTIPIISITRSFKATKKDIVLDPNGNEMILVRGECYNLVRLNNFFKLDVGTNDLEEGIVLMLENGDQRVCVFADELIGEQQVVVKNIPKYIKKVPGISGCTLLGNGDISLIIDVAAFFDR